MINWPDMNFNFNLDNSETVLLGASVLFLLIGGGSLLINIFVSAIFFVLGFMFLAIGIVVWHGNSGGGL